MNSDRFQAISELFERAVLLPAEERAGFLDAQCGDDDGLRREVEKLLETDAQLEETEADDSDPLRAKVELCASDWGDDSANAPLPERIGPYRVLDQLGAGGMGVVYRALQERPRREVALKILLFGLSAEGARRRFEHEAELLGRLHHPGIAQVFDAGTAETEAGPRPYFAMELVDGRSLVDHANAERLGVEGRVELMTSICDAVQHAHDRGIVHRDLKPANIVVDKSGRPKVLDFGIARATDADVLATTFATRAGEVLGTLAYMSPEQVRGEGRDVDARADVYALGSVLQELLTGHLPHDLAGRPLPEAARIICDEDATRLGSIDKSLRGDLETIASKALEKDRERRYPSAAALAADLRRFLHHQPIDARPPSTFYQLEKFTRRNRALVGGVVAAFLLLVIGAAGTGWGLWRALQKQKELTIAEADALEAAARATAINEYLNKLLGSANPFELEGVSRKDLTVAEMLASADDTIADAFPDRPDVEAEVRALLGTTYKDLGRFAASERHLREALRLFEETRGARSTQAAFARRHLAAVVGWLGDSASAVTMLEEVLELERELGGEDSETTALTHGNLAVFLANEGRFDEAVEHAQAAYDSIRKLGPDRATLSASNLARVLHGAKRYEEAEVAYREAFDYACEAYGPRSIHAGAILTNYGTFLHAQTTRLPDALGILEESVSILRETGQDMPVLARALLNYARVRGELEGRTTSEDLLREALDICRRVLGEDHEDTGDALYDLAAILSDQGQHDASAEHYLEAERAMSGGWKFLCRAYAAEELIYADRFDEAEPLMVSVFENVRTADVAPRFVRESLQTLERGYLHTGDERAQEIRALLR